MRPDLRVVSASLLLSTIFGVALPAESPQGGAPTPAPQQSSAQPPPRTTFKSAVDLVPVDVSVVDKSGRPVEGLTPTEFTLAVDGRPRQVVSAQFVSAQPRETQPPDPPYYSSNAGVSGGRLIVLVVDAGNIGSGRGKSALAAAGRFLGRLNPTDRVALITIPGGGPQIDFTSNHQLVQERLQQVVGQSTTTVVNRRVGLGEALAIERGDQTTIAHIVEQQCVGDVTPQARESCLQQLMQESDGLLSETRNRARNSVVALRNLFDRLATSETPKTVVLISEGLLLNRDYSDVAWVGPRSAAAHITLNVLQLDPLDADTSDRRGGSTRNEDREVLREGLEVIAGMARGDVIRIVSNADFAFQRLALELSGYYLLGFEPQPGDRDGKPHKIKVDVRRKDVDVRARRDFSIAAAAAKATDEIVLDTLRAPLLASDIPLKLTTYAFQDRETSKIKVILAAQIDRSLNPGGQISLGYIVVDDKGKVVSSLLEKALTSPVQRETKTQKYVSGALVASGLYTLKVAVVDDAGRRGSVERAVTAQLGSLGQLQVTDLLIADNSEPGTAGLVPTVDARFTGDELHGYLELFSDVPGPLQNAKVAIEVAESPTSTAITSVPVSLQAAGTENNHRVGEAGVPIALLPQGDYVARAVVAIDGNRVGQVLRPFKIVRPASTATSAAKSVVTPKPVAPTAASSRVDTFDKSSVLSPPVVAFFLDRLNASSASYVRPVVEDVRAGRFSDANQALGNKGDDQLAVVFLKGLVLLSRGELDPAANKFRDALKIDSEFYPAAFYLGACYAAGGRDHEAAGAWQTSLIAESGAPFIYTFLGDAYLRLRNVDEAIDILSEARSQWPADDQVAQHLATALVMGGRRADALQVLEPYLAKHPDDSERLFLALRVLYEAHAAGRSIGTSESDRARFVQYADAYAAARGPQLAMVTQWRKQLEKR
jgi:VWFA-related protein